LKTLRKRSETKTVLGDNGVHVQASAKSTKTTHQRPEPLVFNWFKKPKETPEEPPFGTAETALEGLIAVVSDGVIEDVWDAMDQVPDELLPQVETLIRQDRLGEYPRHCAILWHAYTLSNRGEHVAEFLKPSLEDSVYWALTFEINNVLIGGALGALDGLSDDERERLALAVFERLGASNARKYWLLLKVRTDAMLKTVAQSFDRLPEDRAKMVGAFRQFRAEDLPLLKKYHQPGKPGFELFEIAISQAEARSNASS